MRVFGHSILANGLRTDHPIPGLPFVDDSHIPVADADAVEAIGRNRGEGMWGRADTCVLRVSGERVQFGSKAFTTDPVRRDLSWVVRIHPEFGRTVLLVESSAASGLYADLDDAVLLWRAGGYWWDGSAWWRPMQLFDMTSETYVRRAVPAATTVTAAEALADAHHVSAEKVLSIQDVDVDAVTIDRYEWNWHLATWAQNRPADGLPVDQCVVDLAAPELGSNAVLSLNQVASIAGIAAGTLRGYISRGENDIPDPQLVTGGRSLWSLPVINEWIETRAYTPEESTRAVSQDFGDGPYVGFVDLREKLFYWILSRLSRSLEIKPRFALRWRDQNSLKEVAMDLSGTIAAGLDQMIPLEELSRTILDAMQGDLLRDWTNNLSREDDLLADHHPQIYHVSDDTGTMLDWLIRHDPQRGRRVVQTFVGEVLRNNDRYQTNRETLLHTLKVCLSHTKLTSEQREAFLKSAIMPNNS